VLDYAIRLHIPFRGGTGASISLRELRRTEYAFDASVVPPRTPKSADTMNDQLFR
jgi:hypothetical protein